MRIDKPAIRAAGTYEHARFFAPPARLEVNVRQERADDRALRRPLLRLDQVSIFEHACRQPFGDQPDNSPVANPMFDEADQPILVNLVEKGLNVAIEYPVDPPLPDPERERIQRLMPVTLRPETVAEPKNSDS